MIGYTNIVCLAVIPRFRRTPHFLQVKVVKVVNYLNGWAGLALASYVSGTHATH